MRMIVAAALAVSFSSAAFAATPTKTAVTETSAVAKSVDQKDWAQARCWICGPSFAQK